MSRARAGSGWARVRRLPVLRLGLATLATVLFVGLAWTPVIAQPQQGPAFLITGTTTSALVPGVPGRLQLALVNPRRESVLVTAVRVTVGDAAPGCRAANLLVAPFHGHVLLRYGHVRRVRVWIELQRHAPEACRLVVFPLTFSGTAVGRGG